MSIALRQFMKTMTGVVRASNKQLSIDGEDQWKNDYSFVQAADCQIGFAYSGLNSKGVGQGRGYEDYADCTWEREKKWCKSFIDQVNAMNPAPRFAVMCGDLVDAWPHKWQDINAAQRKDFIEWMSHLTVPLVCVCGNHDVGNTPTHSTVQNYRKDFGDDFFSFWCGGVFFIVLNSQYHEDPSQVAELAAEQEVWLEEQLKIVKSGKCQHSVVFQHIPYFLKDPKEEKQYFNLAEPLRSTTLTKLHEAGVSKIFCGHYHRNAGGWYKNMELIVTSAIGLQLGETNNGFRVVDVTKENIEHKYVELTEF